MAGMFDNFDNLDTSYVPNASQPKYPAFGCTNLTSAVDNNPIKPFILKNIDGSLKGYFWYEGDSVLLVFNVSGSITLLNSETYIAIEDIVNDLVFKATFFNFKHERVVSFDNTPNSENSLTCKLNIDTEGNVAGTELIFEITSKMSEELFVKGLYYLDLVVSHPSGYCEHLFSTNNCVFEVR